MTLPEGAISWNRKWMAIGVTTAIIAVSTWALVLGAVAAESEHLDAPGAGLPTAIGLGLAPFAFMALAFLSQHREAPVAVLKAMGVAIAIAFFVSALGRDIVSGLIAGYGAGGVVALRAEELHNWKARALAGAIGSVYVRVLMFVVPPLGIALAPFVPLTSTAIADIVLEYRASQ